MIDNSTLFFTYEVPTIAKSKTGYHSKMYKHGGIRSIVNRTNETAGKGLVAWSPEDMRTALNAYFSEQNAANLPYTFAGLCRILEIDRETLHSYTRMPAYTNLLKKAVARVLEYAETYLYSGKNPAGVIFLMKNNFGYRDIIEQVHHKETIGKVITAIEGEIIPDGVGAPPLLLQEQK